jgi:hypothetical protein
MPRRELSAFDEHCESIKSRPSSIIGSLSSHCRGADSEVAVGTDLANFPEF